MSRYLGGGFTDPEITDSEAVFTNEEILQAKIQEHLDFEEAELEEIKENYKGAILNER